MPPNGGFRREVECSILTKVIKGHFFSHFETPLHLGFSHQKRLPGLQRILMTRHTTRGCMFVRCGNAEAMVGRSRWSGDSDLPPRHDAIQDAAPPDTQMFHATKYTCNNSIGCQIVLRYERDSSRR